MIRNTLSNGCIYCNTNRGTEHGDSIRNRTSQPLHIGVKSFRDDYVSNSKDNW